LIPGVSPHPSYSPAPPCEALKCDRRAFRIDACREESCPHRWQREGAEETPGTALLPFAINLRVCDPKI